MADNLYSEALFAAWAELDSLRVQERDIAIRKAQLQQTVNALYPLVFDNQVDINALSLPDAMRLVLRSTGRPLSGNDFKTKLEDMGFELSKFANPLANIMTAMNRMVEAEEMIWFEQDGKPKKAIPGPELKSVPELDAPDGPPAQAPSAETDDSQ
jgi:hypothetical protein